MVVVHLQDASATVIDGPYDRLDDAHLAASLLSRENGEDIGITKSEAGWMVCETEGQK